MLNDKTMRIVRIIAVILAIITLVGSSGCIKKTYADKLDSVKDIAQFALDNGKFPEMKYEDEAVLTDVYGIDLTYVAEYMVMVADDNLLADTIAVFRVTDRGYIDFLSNGLKSRLAAEARIASQYSPDQYNKINSCEVKWYGDYVFYIVNDDGMAITRKLMSRISPELH